MSVIRAPAIHQNRWSIALPAPSRALEFGALLLLAGTLWLATHPYIGIYHDAIIYSLLAARWLEPSSYANDLFFIYGAQDDLNLFTPIFGGLAWVFGLDIANRVITLVGGVLWVSSSALLAFRVFGSSIPFRFVVLAVAATSLSYSPNHLSFVVNENFATARTIAMPLVLLGIWADLCKWRLLAMILLIVALLIHPLLGIWGAMAFFCIRVPALQLVIAVCCGVVMLAINHVYPLSIHLAPMSVEWVKTVRSSSIDVLFAEPGSANIGRFLWWIGVLWAGAHFGNGVLCRYYLVVALMTAYATLLTQYCSYINPVELLVQVQPWRVLWLAIALGWLALADILWRAIKLGWGGLIGLGLALIALYLAGQYAWFIPILSTMLFVSPAGKSLASRIKNLFEINKPVFLSILAVVVLVLLPGYLIDLEIIGLGIPGNAFGDWQILRGWMLGGGIGLSFIVLACMFEFRMCALVILASTLPIFIFTLIGWDNRSIEKQLKERDFLISSTEIHPFSKYVKPGDVMIWSGHELDVWFLLHASNYASGLHLTGNVFSKKRGVELKSRLERIFIASYLENDEWQIKNEEGIQRRFAIMSSGMQLNILKQHTPDKISVRGGEFLCKDNRLHWFVSICQGNEIGETRLVKRYTENHTHYCLYSCEAFNQGK